VDNPERPSTILSLCSGGAGLDTAVATAFEFGGRSSYTVGYVEREAYCILQLAQGMQAGALDWAPIETDLKQFRGPDYRGCVDGIIAGIPCQGNSLAGKRLLQDDPRNLWPDTRRIIRDVGPDWFLLENVRGILIPDKKKGKEAPIVRILGELAEDGFDAVWGLFSAREAGGTHLRHRLFMLAHRPCVPQREQGSVLSSVAKAGQARNCTRVGNGQLADCTGPARGRDESIRGQEERATTGRHGPDLAPASGSGLAGRRTAASGTDEEHSLSSGGGGGVAFVQEQRLGTRGTESEGLGREPGLAVSSSSSLPISPPSPDDYDGWERVLAVRPDLAPATLTIRDAETGRLFSEAESPFRGVADAMGSRTERLRMLGNGVDEAQGAFAFFSLATAVGIL
jgi:DNA (cytosine-5)-methyltransferase 1